MANDNNKGQDRILDDERNEQLPRRYTDPFEGKLGQRIIEEKLKKMERTVHSNKRRLDDNDEVDESQQNDLDALHQDLADVAFSGDYDDLENKPTIPADQVQADWNESDSSSKSFIANKPTIPAAQVQADWNESDSNSKAFIANKPTIPAAQVQADWNESDSNSKAFIANKPTIPAAQVQADWNQTGDTKPDYIKNKPNIPLDRVHRMQSDEFPTAARLQGHFYFLEDTGVLKFDGGIAGTFTVTMTLDPSNQ